MNWNRVFWGLGTLVLALAATTSWAEDLYFDSDGTRIRYTDEGEGPPVILIHGYTANGDLNWRVPRVIALLSPDYRVITLDNRGHGRSDKPEDVESYGPHMAHDVLRLMDHLQIERAHFVGYSMGGMITFKVATIAPERMLSAVVGGMGWVEEGPAVEEREDTDPQAPSLVACARAFPTLGITRDELKAIEVPLTIVIGEQDGLLERRVTPLRDIRPDIPVVLIPNANHITCVFRPEFRQAIKQALDEQVAGKGDTGR